MASTSRVRLPCRGGTLHSTSSGSPPNTSRTASTCFRVGGTTGSPSVHPCSKYHSTRLVPAGTRRTFLSIACAGFNAGRAIPWSPRLQIRKPRISLSARGHRVLPDPQAVQRLRQGPRTLSPGKPSQSLLIRRDISQTERYPGIEAAENCERALRRALFGGAIRQSKISPQARRQQAGGE